MTFPSIRSSNTGTTVAAGGHVAPMPASIVAGDLLVVLAQVNVGRDFNSMSSGWTHLINDNSFNFHVFVRVAAGSDTFTLGLSGSTCGVGWTTMSIQDWEGTLAGIEAGNANNNDPPTLSPSWGSADSLWLELIGAQAGTLPAVSAWSTNYTEIAQVTGDFGTDVMAGAAYRLNTTDTENPDPITVTGSPSQTNVATIAVEPSDSLPATTIELTATTALYDED